jgi:hypothetical protein
MVVYLSLIYYVLKATLEVSISLSQGIIVFTVPGKLTLITPAQLHIHLDVLFKAGILAINTVGAPGTQGAIVIGIHGMGVKTPNAAAVAAATMGFAGELQTPNGIIFTIGI